MMDQQHSLKGKKKTSEQRWREQQRRRGQQRRAIEMERAAEMGRRKEEKGRGSEFRGKEKNSE